MSDLVKMLLGVAAFILLCIWCLFYHQSGTDAVAGGASTATNHLPVTPASFEAKLEGGKALLNGVLPDEAAKSSVTARAAEVFGAGNFIDNLKVGGPNGGLVRADNASWLNWVLGMLPFVKRGGDGGAIVVGNDAVTIRGQVPDQTARLALLREITAVAPTLNLNDLLSVGTVKLSDEQLRLQSALNQILIKGIEFNTGSAEITPAGGNVLDEVAAALKTDTSVNLEVNGHTDNIGAVLANNRLSQARAEAVRKYLTTNGIAPNRLSPKGYGPSQPIGDNNTDQGRQRNRRIEFRIAK